MLDYLHLENKEIFISKYGKPYFKNSNIYFNYSHSKNYIACAVSDYEVGIDIEQTNRIINNLISQKYLDNEINNKKKIEKWVKKEAYSKLKGKGFLMKFQTIKLENIKNKYIFFENDNYMCCIFSDNAKSSFKKIFLDF